MAEQPKTFTPHELRHRDPEKIWAEILANETLMRQAQEAMQFFDQGGSIGTWEEMVARSRARRDEPAV